MNKKILAAILFSFLVLKAQAGIFISPGFHYSIQGDSKPTYTFNSSSTETLKNKFSGYGGTLKLGLSTSGIDMGVLYQRNFVKTENETCPTNWTTICESNNTSKWQSRAGAFIGFHLPINLSLGFAYAIPIGIKNDIGLSAAAVQLGYSINNFIKLVFSYSIGITKWYDSDGNLSDLPKMVDTNMSLDKVEINSLTVGIEFPIGF